MAKVPGFWEMAERLTGIGPWAGPELPQPAPRVVDDPGNLTPDELSIVTPEQFDRAFEEYRQLGPRMTIPIEKRWPAAIPDVDWSKYPALKEKCDEIRWTVVRWDYLVQTGRLPEDGDVVGRMIAIRYPYLTPRHRISIRTYASFANR